MMMMAILSHLFCCELLLELIECRVGCYIIRDNLGSLLLRHSHAC